MGLNHEEFLQEIEIIKSTSKRKKAKNSKAKGNRGELELCKILEAHFGKTFKKVPQSGAHVGGMNYNAELREDAVEILASDIITPKGFKFSIEHKNYNHDSVRITHLLSDKDYDINEWWKQCKEDAVKAKKLPMLVIKLDRAERFAVIEYGDNVFGKIGKPRNFIVYMNDEGESLLIINLKYLLNNCSKEFWGIEKN